MGDFVSLEKREIVSKFLGEGYQLDVEVVEYLVKNPEEIEEFIKTLKNTPKGPNTPSTLTLDYLFGIGKKPGQSKEGIGVDVGENIVVKDIIKKARKKKVGVEEYTSIFTRHYDNLKSLLLEKMSGSDVISVNKIQNQKDVALIVMVREKDVVDGTVLVEDPTGSISVYIDKDDTAAEVEKEFESILEDDVFGVLCVRTESGLKVKQIIWPDIQLKREIGRADVGTRCVLLSGFDYKTKDPVGHKPLLEWLRKTKFKKIYLFLLETKQSQKGRVGDFFKNINKSIETLPSPTDNPTLITLNNVRILILPKTTLDEYRKSWQDMEDVEIVTNLLKRRSASFKGIPLALDAQPDIVIVSGLSGASHTNYKGTTIISLPPFEETGSAMLVELKSREVNKVDFS